VNKVFEVTVLLFEVSNEFEKPLNGFRWTLAKTYSHRHCKPNILRERENKIVNFRRTLRRFPGLGKASFFTCMYISQFLQRNFLVLIGIMVKE